MSNRNYNTQTNPNRQKLMNGGRAKKMGGGMMRKDMQSGYYPSDMGMAGGAMYAKGGPVKKKKKKSKFPDHSGDGKITKKDILMAKGVIPKKASGGSMKKQGYNARKDEQLGMTRGKQAGKKMSMKGRRDVAKATRKPKGSYGFKK